MDMGTMEMLASIAMRELWVKSGGEEGVPYKM